MSGPAESRNYVFNYVHGTISVRAMQGIDELTVDSSADSDVYTLTGRKLGRGAEALKGLRRDLYIMGGKKVVKSAR